MPSLPSFRRVEIPICREAAKASSTLADARLAMRSDKGSSAGRVDGFCANKAVAMIRKHIQPTVALIVPLGPTNSATLIIIMLLVAEE